MTDRLVSWCVLVGLVSALAWAGNLAGPTPKNAVYKYSTATSELILFAVILAAVLWIARGLPKREAFALRAPRSIGRAIQLGLGVFLLIWIVSYALDPLLHPGKEQGLTPSSWQPAHAAAFGVNVFALAVVGPIVEELTFRGLGFTLLERYGQTVAILGIGIAFGIWHGLIDALPVLIVFGTGLAFLRSRTQSVYPGIVLHGLFNGLALLIAVTIQR